MVLKPFRASRVFKSRGIFRLFACEKTDIRLINQYVSYLILIEDVTRNSSKSIQLEIPVSPTSQPRNSDRGNRHGSKTL